MTDPTGDHPAALSDADLWGISDLHAAYVIALDLDDVEAVARLFVEDGTFETHDIVFVGPDGTLTFSSRAPAGNACANICRP